MEAVQIQAYGNPVRVAMAVDVAGDGRVIRFNDRKENMWCRMQVALLVAELHERLCVV